MFKIYRTLNIICKPIQKFEYPLQDSDVVIL